MNNRRQHNSVIVLATLGVYLGLVLVGATPGILAQQAALTKEFNLKDEVERKDDLDKNPDDERSPVDTSVQIYLEDVEYFLTNLGRLQTQGKFDLKKDAFSVVQTSLQPCVDTNIAGSYTPVKFETTSQSARRAIEYFTNGMIYGYSLGDCLENDKFNGVKAVDSRFEFALDAKIFDVNVSVKKSSSQRAIDLRRELESTIKLFAANNASKIRSMTIERTKIKTENDRVVIRTRLPRGSLDSLLAKDAK